MNREGDAESWKMGDERSKMNASGVAVFLMAGEATGEAAYRGTR